MVLHGLNNLVHRQVETFGRRLDDANVRLVRNEPVEIVLVDVIGFQCFGRHVAERLHGNLEHLVSGHHDPRIRQADLIDIL